MFEQYPTTEFEKKYTYLGDDLGAQWSDCKTVFRLWAPLADAVNVNLYQSGTAGTDDHIRSFPLTSGSSGTWIASIEGDLNGIYYTYSVCNHGQWVETVDPYAHAAGVNGMRSMVINLQDTNPMGWEQDKDPNAGNRITDNIIYELHIRDLASAAGSGIHNAGKYLSLTETGTKTRFKHSTGLDHIKELGVTHIHFLPIYDFGSVDEKDPNNTQYNWGYDPVNYNIPEGSYSTNPYDGFARIRELKQMIHTLHRNGLSVIMDVVYNHVYHTWEFCMNQIVPGYFSRENARGTLSNGSGCGNDTASERTMVRKYIVDSVNFWADEYHIDGFRFDLVGLLDTATINEIMFTVKKKHPNVIFYGEGWDIPTAVTKPNIPLAIQRNSCMIPDFAFFNDTIRDTLRGSVFHNHDTGFISGAQVPSEQLNTCFLGKPYWSTQPKQVINYISCHDNHTLYDRIAVALPEATHEEIAKRCRLGAAFNLLSIGVPFFQAGEELLRSKKSRAGVYVSNSYRSSDRINSIKWNQLKDTEVAATHAYYKGLIAIRKHFDVFRLSQNQDVTLKVEPLQPADTRITLYKLTDKTGTLLCIYNPTTHNARLTLPNGEWDILVKGNRAGLTSLGVIAGNTDIPSLSAVVLFQPNAIR